MSSDDLTEISRSETFQLQKTLLANVEISGFSEALSSYENCLQIVELSSRAVVFDFSNDPCPPSNGLALEEDIVFTSSYRKKVGYLNHYELTLEQSPIGEIEILGKGNVAQLNLLCNDEYENRCQSTTQNGQWSARPVILK